MTAYTPGPPEKGEDLNALMDKAHRFAHEQREEYATLMNQHLESTGYYIDQLKAKAAGLTQKPKDDTHHSINELVDHFKITRNKLEEVRGTTKDGWDKARTEFEEMLDHLMRTLDRTWARIGK